MKNSPLNQNVIKLCFGFAHHPLNTGYYNLARYQICQEGQGENDDCNNDSTSSRFKSFRHTCTQQ